VTRPALVDVNVLLPLLLPQHMAHATARRWLDGQPPHTLRFALPVQLGVLRLLSQPRVMGSGALAPSHALETWATLVESTGMQELHAPQGVHGDILKRLVAGRVSSPNLWTDAWLAALAMCLDCEMVTFDQGFASYEGLALHLLHSPTGALEPRA
jgi:uncharacterized protein